MAVNLDTILTFVKIISDIIEKIFSDNKKVSSGSEKDTLMDNSHDNTNSKNNINQSGKNNSITINNNIINIHITNDPSKIGKIWQTINKDTQVKIDSIDDLWMFVGDEDGKGRMINIGKYYICDFDNKNFIFWIGAQGYIDGNCKVYFYINEDQVNKEKIKNISICGIEPDKNRVYVISIEGFTPDKKPEELHGLVNEKWHNFLEDVIKYI